mgnify:CR=1 FL=1
MLFIIQKPVYKYLRQHRERIRRKEGAQDNPQIYNSHPDNQEFAVPFYIKKINSTFYMQLFLVLFYFLVNMISKLYLPLNIC